MFAEDHRARTAKVYLWVGAKESQLPRQAIGIGDVVGIHSGQVAAARAIDAFVQARSETKAAAVTPADQAWVVEAVRDREALIVGTVVAE
jgi:hypothetical protein